jgi:glycosyltransferase involved in cell wall biosynthesis
VVPEFAGPGGVPAVAVFLVEAIRRRPDLDLKIISLSMASDDRASLLLSKPTTWLRGAVAEPRTGRGETFVHVGAAPGELETARLSRRKALTAELADCDLIQVVAGVPAWAGPVLDLNKPVVLQVATLTAAERRMQARQDKGPVALWRRMMTAIVSRRDTQALRWVDAVMVENPWMLKHAQGLAEPGQIVSYAPPGVDIVRYHEGRRDDPALAPYILSVARFADPRKRAALLLEAYGKLCATVSNAPALILAGSDGPDKAFWARAEALGLANRVVFQPNLSDAALAALYRNALCFALASDEEGFGMVVIEAMASGTPVVSTRSGGPDGIISDGEDGYLVDLDDADTMADRLGRLVNDRELRDGMGRAARKTVEARFAAELCGDRFLAVYDQLLARLP